MVASSVALPGADLMRQGLGTTNMMSHEDWKAAREEGHELTLTRKQACAMLDVVMETDLPESVVSTLDEAQGAADEEPQFITIKIMPGAL